MNTLEKHTTILIADDEALARKRIHSFLSEALPNSTILEASHGKETILEIATHTPDLVFLDIKMTDMTGFEVLQQIPKQQLPIIIFVTAFDTYAVKAFEVQALDFLLKPYKKSRFTEALERGLHQLEVSKRELFQEKLSGLIDQLESDNGASFTAKTPYLEKVVLKSNKKYQFVDVATINYIKASGYYAEIFTTHNEKHIYRISMTDFIQQLAPSIFSRINRSAIINRTYVKEVVSEGMGDFSVIMKNKESFTVSKKYKSEFLKKMGIR